MSDDRKELIDTGEREAIRSAVDAEMRSRERESFRRTPEHQHSDSEKMWDIAKEAAGDIADNKILQHSNKCEHEGPLCTVAKTVDQLRVTIIKGTAVIAFVAVALPIGLSLWNNHMAATRAEDSLHKTIEAAANVARELKAVQDAARSGHTMKLPPEAPKSEQLAKVTQ